MSEQTKELRDWESLDAEEQTQLQVEYGYYLDSLPPTCSMQTKVERFRHWLKTEKAVDYRG